MYSASKANSLSAQSLPILVNNASQNPVSREREPEIGHIGGKPERSSERTSRPARCQTPSQTAEGPVSLEPEASSKTNVRGLFLLVAAIVAIIACIIVLFTCYPSAVFLWGDEKSRYDAALQRRKVAWGILIGSLVGGIISKVWYDVLSKLVP